MIVVFDVVVFCICYMYFDLTLVMVGYLFFVGNELASFLGIPGDIAESNGQFNFQMEFNGG